MFKYIKNKIINNFLVAHKTYKVATLFRVSSIACEDCKNFHFDFTDGTTHLGDRLFFIPLMSALAENGYVLNISQHDKVTKDLLRRILGVFSIDTTDFAESDCIIFPAPSFYNLRHKYKNGIIVDFTDTTCKAKITDQLISSVNQLFNLNLVCEKLKNNLRCRESENLFGLSQDNKYWLFSNYIDSGRFRKFFLNENKLLEKAKLFKSKGFKIVHLGSKADADSDRQKYEFVDIDLRGITTITEVIDLVQSPCVLGAITYDNFLMHLVGMYGKVAYVLFRGRFLRKNREHHMLRVNNAFFDQEDKLIYL